MLSYSRKRTSERFNYCRKCNLTLKAPELPVLISITAVSSGAIYRQLIQRTVPVAVAGSK